MWSNNTAEQQWLCEKSLHEKEQPNTHLWITA